MLALQLMLSTRYFRQIAACILKHFLPRVFIFLLNAVLMASVFVTLVCFFVIVFEEVNHFLLENLKKTWQ